MYKFTLVEDGVGTEVDIDNILLVYNKSKSTPISTLNISKYVKCNTYIYSKNEFYLINSHLYNYSYIDRIDNYCVYIFFFSNKTELNNYINAAENYHVCDKLETYLEMKELYNDEDEFNKDYFDRIDNMYPS